MPNAISIYISPASVGVCIGLVGTGVGLVGTRIGPVRGFKYHLRQNGTRGSRGIPAGMGLRSDGIWALHVAKFPPPLDFIISLVL